MTLAELGAIGGIVAGGLALAGLIYGIVSFFARVNRIDRSVQALVIIHTKELIEFYKKTGTSLFNPNSSTEKDALLDKLERGILTVEEADKLERILKKEELEAKRKGQTMAVLAIGALLALILLLSARK